jgi:predicted DCC family thiol-disulfide oxidoreductase YuxK
MTDSEGQRTKEYDLNPVIVFDGECNLCSTVARFIQRHTGHKIFRFAAIHSKAGAALLQTSGIPFERVETIVLIQNGQAYTRSEAVLRILSQMGGVWRLLVILRIVPKPVLDSLYSFVAHNRHRLWGRRISCKITDEDSRR